jgi:SAM-dependent methyltransferase
VGRAVARVTHAKDRAGARRCRGYAHAVTEPERPWYDAAFERDYLELYAHRDAAAAAREVDGLLARGLFAAGGAGRVLDLGCGAGRHLAALRGRGAAAVGLDRSRALLQAAPVELAPYLVRGDFRALPFRACAFEVVVMLFSSFGYFEDDGNARVIGELARVLAQDGRIVLDLMNPARVRASLVPESRTRRGALDILERRRLERSGRRVVKDVVVKDVRVHGPVGTRAWSEDVRLYEPGELEPTLAAAGLAVARREGDFDGRAFGPDAPRQLVWLTRA